MYITHVEFSISPFPASMPNPKALPLNTIRSLDIRCASGVIAYLDKLSLVDGIQADWDSFEHDEDSRRGSVRMVLGRPTTRQPSSKDSGTWSTRNSNRSRFSMRCSSGSELTNGARFRR